MYKTKAPGSLMLLGEYTVLTGGPAIVFAINQFIYVTLEPRADTQITIHSYLGTYHSDIRSLTVETPFQYVLATLASKGSALKSGCDIYIHSEFPARIGLGSSAAVTIAMLSALYLWLESRIPNKSDLWQEAIHIVRTVQGKGSGADLAASLWGGVLLFYNAPLRIEPLPHFPPLAVVYSGQNEINTAEAIVKIKDPLPISLFRANRDRISHATKAIQNGDWIELGHLLKEGQRQMQTLGVSSPFLDELVETLAEQPEITGAKLSGAGFGDCIIGIGHLPVTIFPRNEKEENQGVRQIFLEISPMGLTIETPVHYA